MKKAVYRYALAALCGATFLGVESASAAILLNEVFVNPPGTDDTQEFIELKSSTGGVESLAGLHLLIVEGEGASAGILDKVLDLGSFSTGANGLFLWQANTAVSSISPNPSAMTTVNTADFNPDLENGTQTYLLVSGYTGAAVTTDLDTDNNSANGFSNPAWTSVVDALGVQDATGGEVVYGAAVGFVDFPVGPSGFEPEVVLRLSNTDQWIASDISGANPGGPYTFDSTETIFLDGSVAPVAAFDFDDVSPGSVNPAIPEPSTLALVLIGGLVAVVARRRS